MIEAKEPHDIADEPKRWRAQLARVLKLMKDGQWRTPPEIIEAIGLPGENTAAITARLRDARKPKFGSYVVEKRIREGKLWEYQVSGAQ